MPILLIVGLVSFVLLLILTWRRRGNYAKVAFSLLCVAPVAYGWVGAIHAWGESGSLTWAIGYLSFAILFAVLIYARGRRP